MSNHTEETFEKISEDGDHWIKALDAKEFDLVDEVLVKGNS